MKETRLGNSKTNTSMHKLNPVQKALIYRKQKGETPKEYKRYYLKNYEVFSAGTCIGFAFRPLTWMLRPMQAGPYTLILRCSL